MVYQFTGYATCLNELGFAVAMCAVPAVSLLDAEEELVKHTTDSAKELLRELGSLTVLNYKEAIVKASLGIEPKGSGQYDG